MMPPESAASPAAPRHRRLPHSFPLGYALAAIAIAGAYAIMALDGSTIDALVQEDGVVEWTGALGLLTGAGLFLAAFVVARRRGAASGKSRAGTWALLAFAVGSFVMAGEEISWGQRLLGLSTPESIGSVNAQGETNLHNLQPFQGTLFDGDRLFRLGWLCVFVLPAVAAWLVPRWGARLRALLPVPPIGVALLFVFAWAMAVAATRLFDADWDSVYAVGSAATEIQEMVIELLIGVVAFFALQQARSGSEGT